MPIERRWAMDGPSARAVGQEGEPKVPDVSRANKRGRRPLVTLGLSKVTRPGPKGGRNPVEGRALVFHGAQPHQGVNRRLRNSVKFCQGAGETPSRAAPSRPMRRSRIKGVSCWYWVGSVAVERKFAAVQCAALIAPYGIPLRGIATPSQPIRERPNTLRHSNLQFDNAGGLWVPSP
ncbi:hypothetical protein D3C77_320970 [compost metagenome]